MVGGVRRERPAVDAVKRRQVYVIVLEGDRRASPPWTISSDAIATVVVSTTLQNCRNVVQQLQ